MHVIIDAVQTDGHVEPDGKQVGQNPLELDELLEEELEEEDDEEEELEDLSTQVGIPL